MRKVESIARRILGWKLNRWDRWYDRERGIFIQTSDFQPQQNLEHAMMIVERLEKVGFTYSTNGVSIVSFNNISATGDTLAQAITNAAYAIVEKCSIPNSSFVSQKLC